MWSGNFSKNKLRWFWSGILVIQTGLVTISLLYSIRSVWSFINGYLDKITGLNEYSFPIVYTTIIVLLAISVILLIFVVKTSKIKFPNIITGLFVFEFILHIVILSQLYPDLQSMYLSQLPYWLLKEKALIFIVVMAIGLTAYFILKYKKKNDFFLKILLLMNGTILIIVLSFTYIAISVRSFDFGKRSLESEIKNAENLFRIDTRKTERLPEESPNVLKPDISVKLDMKNGGNYIIAGDLTGDGIVEIITVKLWVEPTDVNRIKSVAVQSMLVDSVSGDNGKTIWNWNSSYKAPADIEGGRGSSAAIAVFDLETGEANKKLLMATDGWLYEFLFDENGMVSEKKVSTGTVNSSDCLIIANLDGQGRHNLLLKDAYHTIWAFNENLELLWKVKNPGGYLLAHRIGAYDINSDGKDEILSGAAVLNSSGEVINTLKTNTVKLWYGGHIDGIVPIIQNDENHISVTYCDGLGFALFDEQGNKEWEITGDHFEYLAGGYFFNTPELKDQFQLISKVHYKSGDPQVMMNQDGKLLGIFEPSSTVFPVDWTGDGYHEMVFVSPATIYSGLERMADLHIPVRKDGSAFSIRVADMIGRNNLKPDGIPDIAVRAINDKNEHFLYLYTNKNGKTPTNYVYPGIGWEEAANYFTKYYEYER